MVIDGAKSTVNSAAVVGVLPPVFVKIALYWLPFIAEAVPVMLRVVEVATGKICKRRAAIRADLPLNGWGGRACGRGCERGGRARVDCRAGGICCN